MPGRGTVYKPVWNLGGYVKREHFMTITQHMFRSEVDIARIASLIKTMPLATRHVIDFPWRLSSPTIYEGPDTVFWEDAAGQVVGFAAWQSYWAVLDFFILPGQHQKSVEEELFAWADERFRELDEERGKPLPYWVEFRDDDVERRQLVEDHGFLQDEGDRYVLFRHSLIDLPPTPTLPNGFVLRTLAGEQEAAAYAEVHRAAFESTSMTNVVMRATSIKRITNEIKKCDVVCVNCHAKRHWNEKHGTSGVLEINFIRSIE
jgi:mycothiol synthase